MHAIRSRDYLSNSGGGCSPSGSRTACSCVRRVSPEKGTSTTGSIVEGKVMGGLTGVRTARTSLLALSPYLLIKRMCFFPSSELFGLSFGMEEAREGVQSVRVGFAMVGGVGSSTTPSLATSGTAGGSGGTQGTRGTIVVLE